MRRTLAFFILCIPVAGQESVSRIGFSESRQAIRAFSATGEVTLPALRVQLDTRSKSGKDERGDLTVIHDPRYGHYLWRFIPASGPSDTTSFLAVLESGKVAIYAGADGIVDFGMSNSIYVQVHRERAEGLDAATNAAIAQIQRNLPTLQRNGYDTGFIQVAVFRVIGMDFACAPYPQSDESCSFGIKSVVSISQVTDGWRLVVRNRWDQEIILDSQFKLVSTRRLASPEK